MKNSKLKIKANLLLVAEINIDAYLTVRALCKALVMAQFNKGRLSQYLPKFSLSRNVSGNAIKRHLLLSSLTYCGRDNPCPVIHHAERAGEER